MDNDGLGLMATVPGMTASAAIIVRDAFECGDAEHIEAAPAPCEWLQGGIAFTEVQS